jgi:hypothetical protein
MSQILLVISLTGAVPPFPSDLLEGNCDSPNIYVTSPTAGSSSSRFPPPLRMGSQSLQSLSSPSSSPTAAEFPQSQSMHTHNHHQHHQHHQHPSLSRQHSFQHVCFSRGDGATSTPLPSSPGPGTMDLFDGCDGGSEHVGRGSTKRQRTSNNVDVSGGVSSGAGTPGEVPGTPGGGATKKASRARSDSAPLGYGIGGLNPTWAGGTRPRSGSGMAGHRGVGIGLGMTGGPGVGLVGRGQSGGGGPPMLSISTATNHSPGR